MVKIKICGLQSDEDITYINALDIDYAGFIFAKSRHQVHPKDVARWISNLTYAKSVAVFVNEDVKKITELAKACKFDIIQLHGDETQQDIHYLKQHTRCEIWKVLHIHTSLDIRCIVDYSPDRFLIDYYEEGMYGGSGKEIEDDLLSDINLEDMLLAGGINSENIERKIALHPYGLDISSGVETNGIKDFNKIKEIVRKVRVV